MRILYLSDDFPPKSFGGAGIVAYNIAKTIKDLGHDVHVITATQDKNEIGYRIQDGLKVHRIYSRYHRRWQSYFSLYNPRTIKKVAKIIAEVKPDIMHANNIHSHLSYHCLRIAKMAGLPVFLTSHDMMLVSSGKIKLPKEATCGNYVSFCKVSAIQQVIEYKRRYNPFRNIMIHYYLGYADKIFCFSHAQKKVLALNGIDNLEVIHSAVDPDAYAIKQDLVSDFKKRHDLEGKKIILFGGRVTMEKGIQEVMSALDLVAKKVPDALLVIAGVGGTGLENKGLPIKFLGWLSLEEMKLALAASDVIVFASICFDVFGMMVLEAMASKKPVVGTCFGGASEAIENGVTGFVVNPRDVGDMSDKITLLLQDGPLSKRFGEAGFAIIKNKFDIKMQASEILVWYHEALKNINQA